jgi:uncharacterized membrane protein
MKETKKFFDNNRLNKGSGNNSNTRYSDASLIKKKYGHVLPPIDMLEQYEELNPGTFVRIIDMAEKEQSHRHNADLAAIKSYSKAMEFGRIFALIFIALVVACAMLIIFTVGSIMLASVFIISAFASIIGIAYFSGQKIGQKVAIKGSVNYHSNNRAVRGRNKNHRPYNPNHPKSRS